MKDAQKDFLTGLLFIVFGLIIRIFIIPNQASNSNMYGLPSSFFPNVVAYIIIALSILLILKSIINGKDDLKKSMKMFIETSIQQENLLSYKNAFIIFIICIGYFIGLILLSFIYITPITIILIALYFGWRKWISLILTSVLVTVAIQYLFESMMNIPLP